MHLPDYVCHVLFRRHRLLNLPVRCEVVEKALFWGPRFVGEGMPQISVMHFQIALVSDHMAGCA